MSDQILSVEHSVDTKETRAKVRTSKVNILAKAHSPRGSEHVN